MPLLYPFEAEQRPRAHGLAAYTVRVYPIHAWDGSNLTEGVAWVTVYQGGEQIDKRSMGSGGYIEFPLDAGVYDFYVTNQYMKPVWAYSISITEDTNLEVPMEPYNTVEVKVFDFAVYYETGVRNYLSGVLVYPSGWIPESGTTPDALFDWGYGGYNRIIPYTISKTGYETRNGQWNTSDWSHGVVILDDNVSLVPIGWEPPPPEFEHNYVETHREFEIHFFPEPDTHGIYVLSGESPPTGPVPIDEKWHTADTLVDCRAIIDNWLENPLHVMGYPAVTWETHVDPGWEIYMEPAGTQRYYAISNETGERVGPYYPNDNLQGLLDYLDANHVPTGLIETYQATSIIFHLDYLGLPHVYTATVDGQTEIFSNWRLQDCRNWIDSVIGIAFNITDVDVPDQLGAGEIPPTTVHFTVETPEQIQAFIKIYDISNEALVCETNKFYLSTGTYEVVIADASWLTTMPERTWNLRVEVHRWWP